jgi:hypothetical protein
VLVLHETSKCRAGNGSPRRWFETAGQVYAQDFGNSHMLMQDKNSLEVADWLLAWIDRNIEHQRPN